MYVCRGRAYSKHRLGVSFFASRRRGGSVADPPGCLLGTLEAHLGARDPLEGGGKAATVTPLDVKARETQVAVVPPRPSPPPPCQSLTRASSWTACAWQGRHMQAWARARAWSGKARASWARSYRTVGSRSSMRATGGAVRRTFRRLLFGFGVRELVIRDGVRTSHGQRRRRRFGDHPGNQLAARLLLNGCLPILARAISARHQG